MRVRFGVLGPLQVTTGDTAVRIGSAKQRRLLGVLLVHAGTVVSTDRLVDALWGDDPPATALQSLRTYVYRLRETLAAGELLATRPPGYVLEVGSDQVDAGCFERLLGAARGQESAAGRLARLDEALGLWRGPAYAEFADAEPVRAEAARLEELRRVAEEERFDACLALGRHAEVVGELEAFVAQHPLRERAQGQLMVALYRGGRQAEALMAAREMRNRLAEEYGLDVPAALERLERDILQQAPTLDAPIVPRSPEGSAAVPAPPPVADAVTATLPLEATSLVGREHDLAGVERALQRARLVTVTGVGGVGKTRLALRVARTVAPAHPDGAWWCELAPVGAGGEVADAVATTLGVRPGHGDDPVAAVVDQLRTRRALLVLDNCEHVAGDVRRLAEALLEACPDTVVLATSRTPLGVAGEWLHRLPPLDAGAEDDPADSPALLLFEERSAAVRPGLAGDAAERRRMAAICRRLDGLPLAIELAASRLRSLNPADLAERLGDRLDLIADARREDGRHQGLRAVLDWSHHLLGTVERRLFARLSVFAGPFTLEAAEYVGGGEGVAAAEVVDLLTGLVDHNLVTVLPTGGATRYALLETLRAYGRERLREAGEEETVRRRHAEYYVALAEDADRQVRSREEALGVARLDRALDNLRAAHRWTIEHGEVDLALRLAAALFHYALWRLRAEVLGWAEDAAALPGADTHALLPAVTGMAGWAAGLGGDLDAAADWAARGLDALADPADPRAVGPLEIRMHTALWSGRLDDCLADAERAAALVADPFDLMPCYVPGLALTYAGRPEEALARMDAVLEAADRHGNPTMRCLVRYTRGEALLEIHPPRAVRPLEEAAELAAAVDNRMMLGVVDVSLVSLQARHGRDTRRTLDTFLAVIDRLHEGGDWTHLWTGLRSLVGVLVRLGRDEDAAVLLGAVRDADNAPPVYGDDAERLAALEAELGGRLGPDVLADARGRGRAMPDHEAIAFVRAAIGRADPRRDGRRA